MAQARSAARLVAARRQENPWARLRWLIALTAAVIAYGVTGYMLLERWSFLDALYMTLITLTSVGFEEVRQLDSSGEVFTISLLLMGVSFVVVTLSLIAASVAEGALGERGRRRRMQRRLGAMRDHFIICAYGRVGRTVARELEAEGAAFVVIDILEDLEEQMIEDGVVYLIDDPTSEEVLKTAGVERARGLICAMDSDASNVFVALTARSLNPEIFIVGRSSEAAAAERLYRAGADRVVSPYVTSGRHMALLSLRPRVVDYVEVTARDAPALRLEELQVEPDSELVGRTLAEVSGDSTPLAVCRRGGEIVSNPDRQLRLEPGDLLVLLGSSEALRPVEER